MALKFDIKQFCTVPPPYGGVTVFVSRLIRQLTKDGYKVGGYYSSNNIIESPLFDKWTWMETSLFPIKIWKYVRETRHYKIIHSHFSLEGMIYLWTLKNFFGKKIIVSIHNAMCSSYYKSTNPINRFFLKLMLNSDVCWIAVSEQGREQLLKFPVKIKSPIYVIPPYIPDLYSEDSNLSKDMQDYINHHKKIIVFYAHSFMKSDGKDVYGLEIALKVYSKLVKEYTDLGLIFCLAETKDSKRIAELHQMAINLQINDKIFWQIGAIDNMRSLWKEVHIYFRPTSTDGDSIAIREALDNGVIVIASNVTDRPDGVMIYNYNDIDDGIKKIKKGLTMSRNICKPDMKYYNRLKSIYDKLLLNKKDENSIFNRLFR